VVSILRPEEEGRFLLRDPLQEGGKSLPVVRCEKFFPVTAAEFLPPFGVVPKPLAKRGARSQLPDPLIDPGPLLAESPGPEAVHKDPKAIFRVRRVVDAL
jgi:hypothetical protein